MNWFDLSFYTQNFSLTDVLDILLVTAVIFVALQLVQGTRAIQLLRGLILLAFGFVLLNNFVELPAFRWLVSQIFPILIFAIPVIFQPELRRALEQVGRAGGSLRFFRRTPDNEKLINAIAEACRRLSARRHGALIVIEKETGLQEYIDTGVRLDAMPSMQLLLTIFQKDTELHDGAVIVKDGVVAAASCIMPLSSSLQSDRKMGLRHRAALGISEVSDAVAIIVSEETGQISIAHNGRMLRRQDPARFESVLKVFIEELRPDVNR